MSRPLSADWQVVDASHSIIDIIRPRYPRGALLEGGVEPLDNLGEVLVARVRRGVEGYACEASAADAPKLGEEVFAEDGLDDRLGEMGGCASVGGRSKDSRAARKASKGSAALPHVCGVSGGESSASRARVESAPTAHLGFVVGSRAPDVADLLADKRLASPLAKHQVLHDKGQHRRQVHIQRRLVQILLGAAAATPALSPAAAAAALDVIRGELYRALGRAVDVNEPRVATVAGDQHIVEVVEIKGLHAHQREVAEAVEETHQQHFDLDEREARLQCLNAKPLLNLHGVQIRLAAAWRLVQRPPHHVAAAEVSASERDGGVVV